MWLNKHKHLPILLKAGRESLTRLIVKLSLFFKHPSEQRRVVITSLCLPFVILAVLLLIPPPSSLFEGEDKLILLSAEGKLLRSSLPHAHAAHHQWIALSEYPKELRRITLFAEDRRFYKHPGVDPIAILRSMLSSLKSKRVTGGGSTITQQLVRITYKNSLPENRWARKVVESYLAFKLEIHCSKERILEAYLNLVPHKDNRAGLASASEYLFHKHVSLIDQDESIALAVLIRRSSMKRESFIKGFDALKRRLFHSTDAAPSERIIDAVYKTKKSDSSQSISLSSERAPHFADYVKNKFPTLSGTIRTTINEDLNRQLLEILLNEMAILEESSASNGAVVVLELPDHAGGDIRLAALVGSKDYTHPTEGQVNGAVAVRVAGSTLKPFIYALAMNDYSLKPYSLLKDDDLTIPTGTYGYSYRPRNYDLGFWGTLTAREALASSRNIPPVELLHQIGEERFLTFLTESGIDHINTDHSDYGAGIVLGSAGVTLLDLTRAYSMFPLKGRLPRLMIGEDSNKNKLFIGKSSSPISEATAFRITDILADRDARRRAFGKRNFLDFPYPVATKTGTSKDYIDAWSIGFTERYVVGVWIGNFSGKPMHKITGAWGAGRVLQQTVRLLHDRYPSVQKGKLNVFELPAGFRRRALCRVTGLTAGEECPAYMEVLAPDEKDPPICDGEHHQHDLLYRAESIESRFAPEIRDRNERGSDDNESTNANNESRVKLRAKIESPVEGETFLIDPHTPSGAQAIPVRIFCKTRGCGGKPLYLYLDGKLIKKITNDTQMLLLPDKGRHDLNIQEEHGEMIQRVGFSIR